ncbi:hypothetical protein [Burkholderia orbicola]|uniref:hypothetical protein n=1 Tax=Burkholderia orbicola TaxID=2978683 RepID=UPI002653B285|nr:hypothetical protein [Burkholderia orbicola]MDN7534611.1 hypothetical protein [Burkholderia orbicola]
MLHQDADLQVMYVSRNGELDTKGAFTAGRRGTRTGTAHTQSLCFYFAAQPLEFFLQFFQSRHDRSPRRMRGVAGYSRVRQTGKSED